MEQTYLQARSAYPEAQSFVAALACLSVLYFLMPKLPRGLPRALCVVPCFPILAAVPFSMRSHVLRTISTFAFLWLCPSKLLLRCWDVIPDFPVDGLLYFLSTSVMPLRVKGRSISDGSGKALRPRRLQGFRVFFLRLFQFLLLSAVENIIFYAPSSGWGRHALYCLFLYIALEWVLCVFSGLTGLLLGLELHPFFDKPFLASSLSEFWGKRWNCLASFMLRETVYMPVLCFLLKGSRERCTTFQSSCLKSDNKAAQMHISQSLDTHRNCETNENREIPEKVDKKSVTRCTEFRNTGKVPLNARLVAMLASFTASGLIHELIFYCITKTDPTWEVTLFFILNGVANVLEVYFKRNVASGRQLPKAIAIFCTLSFIFVSSACLFMPPIVRSGADVKILAEFSRMQNGVVSLFIES